MFLSGFFFLEINDGLQLTRNSRSHSLDMQRYQWASMPLMNQVFDTLRVKISFAYPIWWSNCRKFNPLKEQQSCHIYLDIFTCKCSLLEEKVRETVTVTDTWIYPHSSSYAEKSEIDRNFFLQRKKFNSISY